MRLNGWQRLWLLLSVAIFAVACHFAADEFPSVGKHRYDYEQRASMLAPTMDLRIRMQSCRSSDPAECLRNDPGPSPEDRARYDAVIAEGESLVHHVYQAQTHRMIAVGVVTALGSVVLYILGLVGRWMVRGFKAPPGAVE